MKNNSRLLELVEHRRLSMYSTHFDETFDFEREWEKFHATNAGLGYSTPEDAFETFRFTLLKDSRDIFMFQLACCRELIRRINWDRFPLPFFVFEELYEGSIKTECPGRTDEIITTVHPTFVAKLGVFDVLTGFPIIINYEKVASDVFTGTTWHDAAKGLLKFIKQFVDHEIEETVWFDGKTIVDPHA